MLDAHRIAFIAANSKKGTRLPDPIHVPRPGEAKKKPRSSSPAELQEFFGSALTVVPREA